MDINTCFKYLNFISEEASRFLSDGKISDDEVIRFSVELNKFKKESTSSNLPEKLKMKINLMNFNYSPKQIELNSMFWLAGILTLGFWSILIHIKRQSTRKSKLEEIRSFSNSLAMEIKLNYL